MGEGDFENVYLCALNCVFHIFSLIVNRLRLNLEGNKTNMIPNCRFMADVVLLDLLKLCQW